MINDGNKPLIDFVVQGVGSAFALFDYSIENELSLNEILTPGQILTEATFTEPEPDNFNEIISSYIKKQNQYNVISGQSILDVSIQEMGSPFYAFELALNNQLSLNEILLPSQKINIPEGLLNEDVVNYYKGNGTTISTYKTGSINESFEFPIEFPLTF